MSSTRPTEASFCSIAPKKWAPFGNAYMPCALLIAAKRKKAILREESPAIPFDRRIFGLARTGRFRFNRARLTGFKEAS
jgi:hypothetical protein